MRHARELITRIAECATSNNKRLAHSFPFSAFSLPVDVAASLAAPFLDSASPFGYALRTSLRASADSSTAAEPALSWSKGSNDKEES